MKLSYIVIGLLLFAASCGKKGDEAAVPGSGTGVVPGLPGAPGLPGVPGAVASKNDPKHDYTKPYLTDKKIQNLLAALKDNDNPLKSVLDAAGSRTGFSGVKKTIAELDGVAKKYGFEGYEDYMAVWGRVTVAQMQTWGEQIQKDSAEFFKKNIASAEEALKKTDLSPEMRQMYEEQVKGSREALEEAQKEKKVEDAISAADMALVKKYQAELAEATKLNAAAGIKALPGASETKPPEEESEETEQPEEE
jgi:hypothetical protein